MTTEDKEKEGSTKMRAELVKLAKDSTEENTEYIETGNIGFDMAISNGLGLPRGASILLWANPGCGKTTLFGDVSRRLIKAHKAKGEEYKVLYIAVEGSRELLRKLGLKEYMDSRDFIYLERRFCWRQIEQLYDMVIEGKPPYDNVKLIVIDSVTNVLSDQNLKKSCADGDYGTRTKERSSFYSKYFPMCKTLGINTFLVSQVRNNTEAVGLYAEKKKAAASDPDKHNADIIIKCSALISHKETIKVKTKTAFGEDKQVEKYVMSLDPTNNASKNRYENTHKCEVLIERGVGVINSYALRKILAFQGFMSDSGGWYTFSKELCEAFGIPEKKMRKDEADNLVAENSGKLVNFLKEVGCYSVTAPDKVERIAGDQDVEEENEEE